MSLCLLLWLYRSYFAAYMQTFEGYTFSYVYALHGLYVSQRSMTIATTLCMHRTKLKFRFLGFEINLFVLNTIHKIQEILFYPQFKQLEIIMDHVHMFIMCYICIACSTKMQPKKQKLHSNNGRLVVNIFTSEQSSDVQYK